MVQFKSCICICGDTGSLALGTVLGTFAVLLRKEILLIIIGGIFVVESAFSYNSSVIF